MALITEVFPVSCRAIRGELSFFVKKTPVVLPNTRSYRRILMSGITVKTGPRALLCQAM